MTNHTKTKGRGPASFGIFRIVLTLLATVILVALAGFACGDSEEEADTSNEPTATAQTGDVDEHVDDADEHTDDADEHAAAGDVDILLTSEGAVFTPEHPPAGGGDVDLSSKNDTGEATSTSVHVHGVDGEGEAVVETGEIAPSATKLVTVTLSSDVDYVFVWEPPLIHVEPEGGHDDDGHDDGEDDHDDDAEHDDGEDDHDDDDAEHDDDGHAEE
jgi:zinc transport system substrate-binding protein